MSAPAELDLQSPAMRPPPGVTPNLQDPTLHFAKERLLTMVLCLTFTAFFVLTRIYTKVWVIKSHGWEDYTCVLAWILSIPYEFNHLILYKYAAGAHLWDVSLETFSDWAKATYARELYNGPLIYVTKLSILLQFRRIFVSMRSGTVYWCIRTTIWINTLYYLAWMLAIAFHCTPIHKSWQPWVSGHCANVGALIITSSLINTASDILILFIPLFCISKLHIPTPRKFGVAAVFVVGIFTCVTSILRTVASVQVAREKDITYRMVAVSLWSDAEVAGGIICGCLPIMPQFVRHLVPKIRGVWSSYALSSKTRSASSTPSKSQIPRRGKTPDPYDDSCNLTATASYNLDSLPPTDFDRMKGRMSAREVTPELRDRKDDINPPDLENGTCR